MVVPAQYKFQNTISGNNVSIDDAMISALSPTVNPDLATALNSVVDTSGLQGQIDTINTEITTINGEITTIQGQITTINGEITTIQGQITTLQSQVNGIPTFIIKPTDQTTISNTTPATDSALQFMAQANSTYYVNIKVFFNTPAAADFKFGFAFPASTTFGRIEHHAIAGGATAFSNIAVDTTASVVTSVTGGGTDGYIEINLTFVTGTPGDVFGFQWSQNSSTASNTTVYAGSILSYQKV